MRAFGPLVGVFRERLVLGAGHVGAARITFLHDNAAARRRKRLFGAHTQRANQIGVDAFAVEA